uniref:AIP3 domain-containing protein n=1 Tax=Meloidogyne hapla TaxID=6305 RepID=A0A1I8BRF7_MELHA
MRNSESNEFDEPIECSSRQRAGSSTPLLPTSSTPIYLFLEHQGETKRSTFPPNLRSIEHLKSLFLRSFPLLESKHLHSNNVKIYIQKRDSPHGLFYELENLDDLEDSCVLRLFEQNVPSSPSFSRRNNAPIIECLSEPEINEWGEELNKQQIIRPSSVLGQNFNKNNKNKYLQQQKRRILIDGGHTSDSSTCSVGGVQTPIYYTKSGSSTPREEVVEQQQEETRRKVDSLERQMVTLCSLVQCALLPYRDGNNNNNNNNSERQMLQFDGALALADSTISTTLSNGSECIDRYKNDFINKEWGQIINELEVIKGDLDLLKQDVQVKTTPS